MSRAFAAASTVRPRPVPRRPRAAARSRWSSQRDLDLPPDDAAALDALIETPARTSGVFLSKAWLSGFFAEPPDGLRARRCVLLREGGAPARRGADRDRGDAPRTCASACSAAALGSDRVDLLAARGFEALCADAFLSWLGETFGDAGFVLELRDVPADSPLWGAIHRADAERTLAPRAPAAGDSHAAVSRSRRARRSPAARRRSTRVVDKHRRWLERRGRAAHRRCSRTRRGLAAFEALARLPACALARPRRRIRCSTIRASLRFHRHVLPLLLAEGRLRMIRMSADTAHVAVFYGLAAGTVVGLLPRRLRPRMGRPHPPRPDHARHRHGPRRAGGRHRVRLPQGRGAGEVPLAGPRARDPRRRRLLGRHPAPQLARAARATRDAAAALAKSARLRLASLRDPEHCRPSAMVRPALRRSRHPAGRRACIGASSRRRAPTCRRLEAYRDYFTQVFLDNPSGTRRCRRSSTRTTSGRIVGFLGRRAAADDDGRTAVSGGVSSQFIVDPTSRAGLVALAAGEGVSGGPAGSVDRRRSQRHVAADLGGARRNDRALLSLYWTRPLRPAQLRRVAASATAAASRRSPPPPRPVAAHRGRAWRRASAQPLPPAQPAGQRRRRCGRRPSSPQAAVLRRGRRCGGVRRSDASSGCSIGRPGAREGGVAEGRRQTAAKVAGWYICHIGPDGAGRGAAARGHRRHPSTTCSITSSIRPGSRGRSR